MPDNPLQGEPKTAIDSVNELLDQMEGLLIRLREKAHDLARQGGAPDGKSY